MLSQVVALYTISKIVYEHTKFIQYISVHLSYRDDKQRKH